MRATPYLILKQIRSRNILLMSHMFAKARKKWTIFMPEYRRDAGVHWLIFVGIFAASVLISIASVACYRELLARSVLGATLAGKLV